MSQRESLQEAELRWQKLALLQQAYPSFVPFLRDMMEELGFTLSEIQAEIGEFLEHGPAYLMIQAQRGQAKTTITAIYAVWVLIHNPKERVLIVSAGGAQANEISTLIVRIIMTVDILEVMRPDKSMGDRTSVEHFDLHYTLKGVDKSPSVACVGVTSNLQGKRAGLLIADDVESLKNSMTAVQRATLLNITRDFTSINSDGRIVYLGTPQSIDSIYNTLPGRGFTVRIWPGRYPTRKQLKHYGDALAPSVARAIEADPSLMEGWGLDGKQGKAIDDRLNEEVLNKKQLDQGEAYFQLQHMLLTAMMDELRYPLKPENLVLMRLPPAGAPFPLSIVRGYGGNQQRKVVVNSREFMLALPHEVSQDVNRLQNTVFYIDPAGGGQNADETGWAFGGLLNSTIYLLRYGGMPGGYGLELLEKMADLIIELQPGSIKIEKNFGHGAYAAVFIPVLQRAWEKAMKESGRTDLKLPPIHEDLVSGQKELRIIGTLEPVIGRGALVINEDAIRDEDLSLLYHDARSRDTYSLLFQLSKITRDRESLIHDDRLDALEGMVRHFLPALAVEQTKAIKAIQEKELADFYRNPLGHPSHTLRGITPVHQTGFYARVRRL